MRTMILGCGYVGSAYLSLWRGRRYVIGTTTTKEKTNKEIHLIKGDDKEGLITLLESVDCLVVAVAPKAPNLYRETYLKTAETLAQINPPHPIVYLGSTGVFGEHHGEFVDEETPLNPTHETGIILKETESVYREMQNTTILRLGGIFGPGREHKKRAAQLSHMDDPGPPEQYCNFIHLDDILRGIDFVLDNHLRGVYHLVCDDHPTRQELYDAVVKQENLPPIQWHKHIPKGPLNHKRVSNSKIKKTGFHLYLSNLKSWISAAPKPRD